MIPFNNRGERVNEVYDRVESRLKILSGGFNAIEFSSALGKFRGPSIRVIQKVTTRHLPLFGGVPWERIWMHACTRTHTARGAAHHYHHRDFVKRVSEPSSVAVERFSSGGNVLR